MNPHNKQYIALSSLFILFCLVIQPIKGHDYDMYCWLEWTKYIQQNSLGNAYANGSIDYPPLYLYFLNFFGSCIGSPEGIQNKIHLLKSITMVFHLLTGYFLMIWIKRQNQSWDNALHNTLFYIFNICILYNGIIWGQVDIIMTFFIFLSCYFCFQKKTTHSLIFFILAINFKIQSIIFLPIIGLMLLPVIIDSFSIKNILKWIFIPVIVQLLILLPFILSGTIGNLLDVIKNSFGKYPFVSMNAYNFWHLTVPGDLMTIQDSTKFSVFTYKQWGLLLFFTTSFFALFPLMKQSYLSIKNRTHFSYPLSKFLIVCSLIPLLFFYFNTQMHERYCHPAFAFLIAYSLYSKKYILSIIGGLAYLLNLEGVLHFMQLPNYGTAIFNKKIISVLFAIIIFLMYIALFKPKKKLM